MITGTQESATLASSANSEPSVILGLGIDFSGCSLRNTRGHSWQDRWTTGSTHRGGWIVLADGIGGGEHGDAAAQAAVDVAAGYLLTSALDEVAVITAFGLAQAAVSPWYQRSSGGATLSIVTLTPARLVCASLGDSPVLVARNGRWQQVSPVLDGPLRSWVGSAEVPTPWLDSWALEANQAVLVCSDGILARQTVLPASADPSAWVGALMGGHRSENGDDATAVAALVRQR